MAYVTLSSIHNPATGTIAPASWGDQISDNFEFFRNPPRARAIRTTNQSIANNTPTYLTFTEESDSDGLFGAATTEPMTIVTAGTYEIKAGAVFAADPDGFRTIQIHKNSADLTPAVVTKVRAADTGATGVQVGCTLTLVVGDTLRVQVVHTAGAALDVSGAFFEVRWVAA